jgi:UDP-galactopyranose mutase
MKKSKYDFVIVGAGMFGSICARELTDKGYKCLVVDKREHIGGNCYTERKENIDVHMYGPHIFHTSNESIWNYMNRFTKFNNFILSPVANYKGKIFSLPFNMWTFSQMWKYVSTPLQAMAEISHQSKHIKEPKNLEEQAIKLVGKDIYKKLIKGYTWKQWQKHPRKLPKEIIQRLPVRFTYNNNYFNDKYQGIPVDGYTAIFFNMLNGIEVVLNVDFLKEKSKYEALGEHIIYTGAIDAFFGFRFGELEYKTTKFVHTTTSIENSQGCAVMNYTEKRIPQTRSIEHAYFTPDKIIGDKTIITYETPTKYEVGKTEPMYPVNDKPNQEKYEKYLLDALNLMPKYYFGGRLAEYKYYDMDKVAESALAFCSRFKKGKP